MRKPALGQQELDLLRYIAETGSMSVGQVVDGYAVPRGLARSTILTMMERLRKKGHLERSNSAGVYRYSSSVPTGDLLKGLVGAFVDQALAGSLSPFVAYLSESRDVSASDLEELQELVDRLKTDRGA
jgi:predicted transcriptional regulator